jgi:hypothetical protein
LRILSALALSMLLGLQAAPAQQAKEAPLTNASVVKLVRAGFKENTVVAIIRSRPNTFDLSPDRLIELKKNGVSEKVILAMLSVDAGDSGDEGWGEDPFFKDSLGGRSADNNNNQGSGNSADIFGNSGGSRGRSRTNGTRGGATDDSETTGSATVKILRPPAEAGGAPPKMERTPTLTNNSIIELVEAGFSEGTIIRRIEQSPVDFDLSPDKLKELRRRRVTDSIINAMTAAMSDAPADKRATK